MPLAKFVLCFLLLPLILGRCLRVPPCFNKWCSSSPCWTNISPCIIYKASQQRSRSKAAAQNRLQDVNGFCVSVFCAAQYKSARRDCPLQRTDLAEQHCQNLSVLLVKSISFGMMFKTFSMRYALTDSNNNCWFSGHLSWLKDEGKTTSQSTRAVSEQKKTLQLFWFNFFSPLGFCLELFSALKF